MSSTVPKVFVHMYICESVKMGVGRDIDFVSGVG